MIAIKFDTNGRVESCKYPCNDLEELRPSADGFALYDWDGDALDIQYIKVHNGAVAVDTAEKSAALARANCMREISQLKQHLTATDYQAIKYAEGYISEADYAEIKAQRQAWRDRINELEETCVTVKK